MVAKKKKKATPKKKGRKAVAEISLVLSTRSKPPAHLDTEAKRYWRETLKLLLEKKIVSKIYSGAFAAMCEAYSEYVRTLKMLKGKVPMVKTDKGNWIQHPLLGVKNKAAERYLKFAVQFGMTPAARAKLAETTIKAKDRLKQYMT